MNDAWGDVIDGVMIFFFGLFCQFVIVRSFYACIPICVVFCIMTYFFERV
jgi:hypothetical protein